jgi:hypothetical protein
LQLDVGNRGVRIPGRLTIFAESLQVRFNRLADVAIDVVDGASVVMHPGKSGT